jgi:hypothetical protein
MTMAKDILDSISTRDVAQVRREDSGRVLAVGVRATSSEEMERREREYLSPTPKLGVGPSWPMPFFPDDPSDPYPEPLSKADVANLRDVYKITEAEYHGICKRKVQAP